VSREIDLPEPDDDFDDDLITADEAEQVNDREITYRTPKPNVSSDPRALNPERDFDWDGDSFGSDDYSGDSYA
jgi:hypothetical protein